MYLAEKGNCMNNLQLIQENMYNLYKMTPAQLDPLLGQTYHRKESGGDWLSESYACVVRVTEKDSWRLYNRLYNELELSLDIDDQGYFTPDRQLSLAVHSVDDGSWKAYIPYTGQDLFLLWSSIIELLTPRAANDCDCWLCFTHRYFMQITKELGATKYDYD